MVSRYMAGKSHVIFLRFRAKPVESRDRFVDEIGFVLD